MTEDLHRRLSKGELDHAETYVLGLLLILTPNLILNPSVSYAKLVDTHFTNAVLQSLPHGQQQVVEEEMPFIPSPSEWHVILIYIVL